MNDSLYQNYVERKHGTFAAWLVMRWHQKMFSFTESLALVRQRGRILEIGPGHGYLALHVNKLGYEYMFDDISEPVVLKMTSLGFKRKGDTDSDFDLIYLSHVLEHCADWVSARSMLLERKGQLANGGVLVVIGPDYLNWKQQFFNVDATHGYPTTLRNVVQLMNDVGLQIEVAKHHRGGHVNWFGRSTYATLSKVIPTFLDGLISPRRHRLGEGIVYSWKTVFGWRQLIVVARKMN
jgi:SAM-dependent methyltransferase